jgi:hypothetical protein
MRQRTTWPGLVFLGLLAVAGTGAAFGQEAKKEATGTAVRPMELYACKYKEAKGPADLQKASANFNAWLDSTNQHDYWAFLLTPYYRSKDQDFDVLWAGGWRTGVDMARGIQRYVGEGSAAAAEFDRVVRCDAVTNFAIMDLSKAPSPPDSGPVTFSNCTVKEGRKFPDALAAVNAWIAYEKEHAVVSDNYLLFPAFGEESSAKYSFKWVTTSSWEAFGKSYDQYGAGGGWQRAEELFGGLLDCDSSRVYVSQRLRRTAPTK